MIVGGSERFGPPWIWPAGIPAHWREEALGDAAALVGCRAARSREGCMAAAADVLLARRMAALDELIEASLACPLEAELAGYARALRPGGIEALAALGIPRAFLARIAGHGDLGAGRVALSRDGGGWEPEGPDPRGILAVRDEAGALGDLLAFSTTARDEWALRTGAADFLGLDRLAMAEEALLRGERAMLRIHATPIDWLAGAGEGICVLEWTGSALARLRALGERCALKVEAGAKERLRAMLAHGGLPRVESINGMRKAA